MFDYDTYTKNQANIHDCYQAFLVRLWRDNPQADWRVTLQHTDSAECRHYSSLHQFIEFIMRRDEGKERISGKKEK